MSCNFSFWDWFTEICSKIAEVVIDTLSAVWDWIVKFKEYIAFAGVLILGIVLCIFATPLGIAVLSGMALSFVISMALNGWEINKMTFLEAAIGGLLGLIGGGITAGASRGLASGIGQKLIMGAKNSKVLGPVLRGGQKLVSKLPAPLQNMFTKGGVIGAVEGAGTSVADDILHGRKINWKNAVLSGIGGAALVGLGSFIVPKLDPIIDKVTTAFKKSETVEIAAKQVADCFSYRYQSNSYLASIALASPIKCEKYGEHFTKRNGKKALKANIEYTSNEGYKYITDANGRIIDIEASLKLGKGKRNNYAQRTVGGDDRLPDDDGGHLIATIFKGSGEIDNLVPMNSNLNRGEWKKLENEWKEELLHNNEVKVKINPKYIGNSNRPDYFKIKYKIGDDPWVEIEFKNRPGGK
jgi:hypothetical protein